MSSFDLKWLNLKSGFQTPEGGQNLIAHLCKIARMSSEIRI